MVDQIKRFEAGQFYKSVPLELVCEVLDSYTVALPKPGGAAKPAKAAKTASPKQSPANASKPAEAAPSAEPEPTEGE